jgi:hypothetical protein
MKWINDYLWLVSPLPVQETDGTDAERRKKVAHGASRGKARENITSPGGATE